MKIIIVCKQKNVYKYKIKYKYIFYEYIFALSLGHEYLFCVCFLIQMLFLSVLSKESKIGWCAEFLQGEYYEILLEKSRMCHIQ